MSSKKLCSPTEFSNLHEKEQYSGSPCQDQNDQEAF